MDQLKVSLEYFNQLKDIVGQQDASTIVLRFNFEEIRKAINLVKNGYHLELQCDINRIDYHELILRLDDTDQITIPSPHN